MTASGLGTVDSGLYGSIMMGNSSVSREPPDPKPSHLKPVIMPGDALFRTQLLDGTFYATNTLSTPPTGSPNGQLLIFNIEKRQDNWYTFLDDLQLGISYTIEDSAGNPPPKNARLALVPGFSSALFKSVKFYMNDIEVSTGDAGAYPLRAHLDFLMSTSASGKTKAASNGEMLMQGHNPNYLEAPPYKFIQSLMTHEEMRPNLTAEEKNLFEWKTLEEVYPRVHTLTPTELHILERTIWNLYKKTGNPYDLREIQDMILAIDKHSHELYQKESWNIRQKHKKSQEESGDEEEEEEEEEESSTAENVEAADENAASSAIPTPRETTAEVAASTQKASEALDRNIQGSGAQGGTVIRARRNTEQLAINESGQRPDSKAMSYVKIMAENIGRNLMMYLRPEAEPWDTVWDTSRKAIYSNIRLDIAGARAPIIPGVGMSLHLTRADPRFYLMIKDEKLAQMQYSVNIKEINLLSTVRKIHTPLGLEVEKKLLNSGNGVPYNFMRVEVKKFTIPAGGSRTWSTQDIKTGDRTPLRTTVTFHLEEDAEGKIDRNPFVSRSICDEYQITDAFFSIDSLPLQPLGTMNGDSPQNFQLKAYHLMQQAFSGTRPQGIDLTLDQFRTSSFMFCADFTRDRRAFMPQAWHKIQNGSLRLDVKFSDQHTPKKPISVYVFSEYPTRVLIYKDRTVVYNLVHDV